MKKPKFKPELIIGGDKIALVVEDKGKPAIYLAPANRITAKQALRMAEWLKDAAKEVKKGMVK